jgi:CRISPR/Cas system-associated endonuclease Cas3-HD
MTDQNDSENENIALTCIYVIEHLDQFDIENKKIDIQKTIGNIRQSLDAKDKRIEDLRKENERLTGIVKGLHDMTISISDDDKSKEIVSIRRLLDVAINELEAQCNRAKRAEQALKEIKGA